MQKLGRVVSMLMLTCSLLACSSFKPALTPINAQVGKNTQNAVASQSNTQGDSNEYTFNSSTTSLLMVLAGGLLVVVSNLGFIHIILKRKIKA